MPRGPCPGLPLGSLGTAAYPARCVCAREAHSYISTTELKPVLKPDVFKEYELQEKTVISHNVAMYVLAFLPEPLPLLDGLRVRDKKLGTRD